MKCNLGEFLKRKNAAVPLSACRRACSRALGCESHEILQFRRACSWPLPASVALLPTPILVSAIYSTLLCYPMAMKDSLWNQPLELDVCKIALWTSDCVAKCLDQMESSVTKLQFSWLNINHSDRPNSELFQNFKCGNRVKQISSMNTGREETRFQNILTCFAICFLPGNFLRA